MGEESAQPGTSGMANDPCACLSNAGRGGKRSRDAASIGRCLEHSATEKEAVRGEMSQDDKSLVPNGQATIPYFRQVLIEHPSSRLQLGNQWINSCQHVKNNVAYPFPTSTGRKSAPTIGEGKTVTATVPIGASVDQPISAWGLPGSRLRSRWSQGRGPRN
jgi:hypothetical protein